MEIQRLSSAEKISTPNATGIIVVGSFAPVHAGHFDAIRSAERALAVRGETISASIFTPNSDSYVLKKLDDRKGVWNYQRRVQEFLSLESGTAAPSYVDDISGVTPPEKSMSDVAIRNASRQLGVLASNLVLVVGTDQIASMRPHLRTNRAVCILRPGYEAILRKHSEDEWLMSAIESGRYIFAERENIAKDISSTLIREGA